MELIDRAIFIKSPEALRLPEKQFPIVRDALETKQDPTHILALKDITIRTFETRRARAYRSDMFADHTELPRGDDREPLADTTGYRPTFPVIPGAIDSADGDSEDLENDGEEVGYQWADREGNIHAFRAKRPAKA